jgi:hypothetical protein
MAYKRKTIDVAAVKDRANKFFTDSTCGTEARKMMMCFIEGVLMDTGNYRGFTYVDGWPCEDETRVRYY